GRRHLMGVQKFVMTPIGHLDRLKPANVARVVADCPGCHTGFNANASASGGFSNNTASGRDSNVVCVACALAGRASPKSAMARANIAFRKFKPTIEYPLFLSVCATG